MDSILLLAKSQKGAAAAKIISDATAANGIYVFSELLALPNIAQLKDDPASAKSYNLLELFAYGSLADYQQSPDAFPTLSTAQLNKLKQLTLVSLAHQSRSLAYSDLMSSLDVSSTRELEDLIIDVIYADLLKGKLHHQEQIFHVEWVAGRDVKIDDLSILHQKLLNFQGTASNLLTALDTEIHRARSEAQHDKDEKLAYATHRNNVYNSVVANRYGKQTRNGSGYGGGSFSNSSDVVDAIAGGSGRVLGPRSAGFRDDGRLLKKQRDGGDGGPASAV